MCHILLQSVSVIISIAVSFATVHFPNGTEFPVEQQTKTTTTMLNSTNTSYASRHGTYGVPLPDSSSIKFQNDGSDSSNTIRDDLIEKFIARGMLQFALQMNFALSSDDYVGRGNDENLIFSPISIASALALVMLGAAGKTYTELSSVLGLVSGEDLSISADELHYYFGKLVKRIDIRHTSSNSTYAALANGIFVQEGYPIKPQFEKVSKEMYDGEVKNLDFISHSKEAKDVINRWVENKTFGRIDQILQYPPSPTSKVIIASALYFNGAWEYPFLSETTSWKPFFVDGRGRNDSKEIIQVIMMTNIAEYLYYYDPILGCQVVGLPYKGRTYSMYLILPDEPGQQALKSLQHKLTVNKMQKLMDSTTERSVILALPRMQLDTIIYLKKALKVLGVHTLFDPYHADLSELSDQRVAELTDRIGNGNTSQEQSSEIPSTTNEYSEHTTMTEANNEDTTQTDDNARQYATEPEVVNFRTFKSSKTSPSNKDHYRNNGPGIFAENVVHKVTIDITETGTEAAAATVVSITRDGLRKLVRFERPFLFILRHEATGSVLFWGTVTRPTPNQPAFSGK
ncbi:leukocyte elastase inhibitor-like [Periplaneta americana]|uniref:leukocyte elastase inhibitor-like n=1 Tax=Periplaneta americana TaxID=6978 RepID=UPI0037E80C17